jgi:hypothetical protein
MPDPYERHGRATGGDVWGPNPSRRQTRAAAAAEPEGKRPPGKKDPNLCKAAHWKGLHQPRLRIRQYGRQRLQCRWGTSWASDKPTWHCVHEEFCTGCGKILRAGIPAGECPDFRPITKAEQDAIDLEIERYTAVRVSRARRRAVINGPQGYRKRKGA